MRDNGVAEKCTAVAARTIEEKTMANRNLINAGATLALWLGGQSALAQSSQVFAEWMVYEDGWTGTVEKSWMYLRVVDDEGASADPLRQHSVQTNGVTFGVPLRVNGWYEYWSPDYASQSELIAAWPDTSTFSWFADGVLQGDSGDAPSANFPTSSPGLQNSAELLSISPGEQLLLRPEPWVSPLDSSRSTWIDVYDLSTGERVWASGGLGANGQAIVFDTEVLLPNTGYNLEVTYTSRFASSFVGGVLGSTLAETAFARRASFIFVTQYPLGTQCQGDMTGDGRVTIVDLLGMLANFGQPFPGGALDGDFNESGVVDIDDLLLVLGRFGEPCQPIG